MQKVYLPEIIEDSKTYTPKRQKTWKNNCKIIGFQNTKSYLIVSLTHKCHIRQLLFRGPFKKLYFRMITQSYIKQGSIVGKFKFIIISTEIIVMIY